jgi:16S rRNA (cytosine967-C5)-methyltransferase
VQQVLLAEAARVTRSGGLVVYATCSLEPEENEEAVAAFLAAHPGWRLRPFSDVPPPAGLGGPAGALLTPAGELLLLPGPYRMGLYAALLERAGPGQGP